MKSWSNNDFIPNKKNLMDDTNVNWYKLNNTTNKNWHKPNKSIYKVQQNTKYTADN